MFTKTVSKRLTNFPGNETLQLLKLKKGFRDCVSGAFFFCRFTPSILVSFMQTLQHTGNATLLNRLKRAVQIIPSAVQTEQERQPSRTPCDPFIARYTPSHAGSPGAEIGDAALAVAKR